MQGRQRAGWCRRRGGVCCASPSIQTLLASHAAQAAHTRQPITTYHCAKAIVAARRVCTLGARAAQREPRALLAAGRRLVQHALCYCLGPGALFERLLLLLGAGGLGGWHAQEGQGARMPHRQSTGVAAPISNQRTPRQQVAAAQQRRALVAARASSGVHHRPARPGAARSSSSSGGWMGGSCPSMTKIWQWVGGLRVGGRPWGEALGHWGRKETRQQSAAQQKAVAHAQHLPAAASHRPAPQLLLVSPCSPARAGCPGRRRGKRRRGARGQSRCC